MKTRNKIAIGISCLVAGIFIFSYGVIPFLTRDTYRPATAQKPGDIEPQGSSTVPIQEIPHIAHIATPKAVKSLYMSACVVGTPSLRAAIVHIADTTEINSLIIDVKDFSGMLSFMPTDPTLKEYVSPNCGAVDMQDFIALLHSKNIYVIGRVTTFQDPYYTKLHPETAIRSKSTGQIWKDKKGISYIDPGSKIAQDHVLAIAKAAHDVGFDEVNFDYIRYPSDGNVSDISLPTSSGSSKPEVLESFFKRINDTLSQDGIVHSADLFGMTTTNFDDLGIGQVLERALPYFDFIDPMVYPSHYPANFNGWKNPNTVPYELIHYVMKRGVERALASTSPINTKFSERVGTSTPALYTKQISDKNKLRPWIQDFNYGGHYGPKEVRAQIQAANDIGLNSWLIWSPSNRYTLDALNSK